MDENDFRLGAKKLKNKVKWIVNWIEVFNIYSKYQLNLVMKRSFIN